MEKHTLAAASYYNQKYFINPSFERLPTEIRNELRTICIRLAEKLHCVFSVGFYDDASFFFETSAEEWDYDYDEVGAVLEIKKLEHEKAELIESLGKWYKIFVNK